MLNYRFGLRPTLCPLTRTPAIGQNLSLSICLAQADARPVLGSDPTWSTEYEMKPGIV
jgi:hypothetical protein